MQEFLLSGLISSVLIIVTCLLVYEFLRLIWGILPRLSMPHRMRILVVILGVFSVHIINVWVYGVTYYMLMEYTHFGMLTGTATHVSIIDFWGCLYFSAITYSTVGFGDIAPSAGLRMIAGAESLNGIIAIGWTVSFTYLAMEKFWAHINK